MPFILQMLQTLLARFPKTLKKSCQESKNCNSIMARAMLTSPQKCITLRKVSLSFIVKYTFLNKEYLKDVVNSLISRI